MAVQVRRPGGINVRLGGARRPAATGRGVSDRRVLWGAFAAGVEGGILIVLASRPGIIPVLLLGAVVLAHAFASFATEDPADPSD